jgi:hypothetical protein
LRRNGVVGETVNGVWNLVLSCSTCNGSGEKGAKVPNLSLVERLNRRNEYLIDSNHPLRETIIGQTGDTKQARSNYIDNMFIKAQRALIHLWHPTIKGDPVF